jgi:ribonuclease P/MRP protein subunit POP5
MRFKNRYYLIELLWETPSTVSSSIAFSSLPSLRSSDLSLQSYQLQSALRESMLLHFGEWGIGRVLQSLQVRYLNPLTNLSIIRIGRGDTRTLAALLAFLTTLRTKTLCIKTCHLGGTIRSCQKAALRLQRVRLDELRRHIVLADADTSSDLATTLHAASANSQPRKNPQIVLNQLAGMLSQYNATKAQQLRIEAVAVLAAAAAAASGLPAAAAAPSATVAPTIDAIQTALQQIEQRGAQEIMEIDV